MTKKTVATTSSEFIEAHTEAELDTKIKHYQAVGYRVSLRFPRSNMRIRVLNKFKVEAGMCGAFLERA